MMTAGGHFMSTCGEEDILYATLPLYHSMGGMLGIGLTLFYGATIIIRRKFSARNFWSDCVRYNATVIFFCSLLIQGFF